MSLTITDILDELGIAYRQHGEHHHATQGWVQIDCPFCSPATNKFRLGINLQWGNTSCWTCGPHKLVTVFQASSGDQAPAYRDLLRQLQPTLQTPQARPGRLILPQGLGPLLPCHKQYLRQRGLNPARLARLWQLEGIGLHPHLAWRLFIPIVQQGKTVSWTTRSIGEATPRYRNAKPEEELVPIRSVLFGMDYVRQAALICEGPFDVFRIGPGAIATLGISYTARQRALLAKIPVRLICFDNEPQAQQRARQLLDDLSVLPGTTQNLVLDAKDPGSASKKEVKLLRKLLV